jgi:ABC-2 type transport system ATP-binding protein
MRGEVFGYLGPNGAGKSTTINLLLGLVRPTAGGARIFGRDVLDDAPAVHRRLAYVPSEASLWPSLTAEEALRFLGNIHGQVDHTYREELIGRFELTPDKRIRALSHGNRQKVPLIAAFASRADLLLLDEPTTGLDPLMERVFRSCVMEARNRGQTVFLSSHILSEVEALCDRVAMLRAGRLIETGSLEVLRGLSSIHVHALMGGQVPDVTSIPGVSNVDVNVSMLECDVSGSMEQLFQTLGAAGVKHLTTRERSLEELFMARYGVDSAETGPSG